MYFLLWRSNNDLKYYWIIRGANNETMTLSEGHNKKATALDAIEVVKKWAGTAQIIDRS